MLDLRELRREVEVAIPFRVGWGFQRKDGQVLVAGSTGSQSLSGWGGVFNGASGAVAGATVLGESQSLSGWGFQRNSSEGGQHEAHTVAIPFRVGWGFQQARGGAKETVKALCRNPFQGGVGFST